MAKKILFIKLTEQGSTVLAYSAILKAVEKVGRNNVYFWVFEENKPILQIIDLIPEENIVVTQNKGFLRFVFQVFRSFIQIRRLGINTVIDMEFFSRSSSAFSYLSGANIRVGYHRYHSELPYRGNLMTHKVQYNPYIHTSLAYLLMVESLNEKFGNTPMPKLFTSEISVRCPEITPATSDVLAVKKMIENNYDKDLILPLILLNPNAGDIIPERKWKAENFILLAQKLIQHYKYELTLCITGSPEEIQLCSSICEQTGSDRIFSLAGKTSLNELIALYSIADVLITNDSGPGHFASITQISNIVLFGPETPLLFGPLGKKTQIIESSLSCRPCVNPFNHRMPKCNYNLCMDSISVEKVFNAVINTLNSVL